MSASADEPSFRLKFLSGYFIIKVMSESSREAEINSAVTPQEGENKPPLLTGILEKQYSWVLILLALALVISLGNSYFWWVKTKQLEENAVRQQDYISQLEDQISELLFPTPASSPIPSLCPESYCD
ncbi:hypothetical protein KKB83_03320 [Patescibacteria group bacterium]|nr:hypothetical protein [Patescibacteria group bacterium]